MLPALMTKARIASNPSFAMSPNHETDVVADDADATELETRGELINVHRHGLLVVARRWLRRSAGAAQVRHDYAMLLGEYRHEGTPHVARFGVPVEQDHGAALTAGEISQPDPIHLGEAFREIRGPGRPALGTGHNALLSPGHTPRATITRENGQVDPANREARLTCRSLVAFR